MMDFPGNQLRSPEGKPLIFIQDTSPSALDPYAQWQRWSTDLPRSCEQREKLRADLAMDQGGRLMNPNFWWVTNCWWLNCWWLIEKRGWISVLDVHQTVISNWSLVVPWFRAVIPQHESQLRLPSPLLSWFVWQLFDCWTSYWIEPDIGTSHGNSEWSYLTLNKICLFGGYNPSETVNQPTITNH